VDFCPQRRYYNCPWYLANTMTKGHCSSATDSLLLNTALEDCISIRFLFAFTQQVTRVIACRRFEGSMAVRELNREDESRVR
jgi:hypothetical protein